MREALNRLYALGPGRMDLGRERLRRLLAAAGDPQLAAASMLVGGTNGKGRVVAALSAVLSQSHRTGAFIKPHLKSIRERWRIDDEPVSKEQFIRTAHRTCDLIDAHDEPITFFEANVLLGALLFVEAGCEVAVWEVGLGGREDACNLTQPLVSVLTNVGYDHQKVLGDTLAEIAADKAQICRAGRPLVFGPPRPGWADAYREYQPVVADICRGQGARLVQLDAQPEELWQRYMESGAFELPPDALETSMAALAELARESGGALAPGWDEISAGLKRISYRGRMERTSLNGVPVLLDAAHNADSLRWLAEVLMAYRPGERCPLIFGCQASHDPLEMLRVLKPVISRLVPIEVPVLHPCPLARIIDAAHRLGLPVELPPGFEPNAVPADYAIGNTTELDPPDNRTNWIECVRHGLSLGGGQPVVICGSIYNLGEILRVFEDGRA